MQHATTNTNLRNAIMQTSSNTNPPKVKDRRNIVFLILLLQGVGVLMPWNMFITARSYFVDYKLSKNLTGEDSHYATYFISYVGFASQVPNLIFNWINVFINFTGSITPRIAASIILELIAFIVTIVFTVVDTSKFLGLFFWITMTTVVLLNMAGGVYQNTIFGMAAVLPSKYSGALILGCNLSGVLVSLTNVLTHIITTSIQTAALYYFIISLFVLLVCLITYFAPQRIKFYEQCHLMKSKNTEDTDSEETEQIPYWQIFKSVSFQLLNVFLVFFVTLSIFPGMQAEIRKSDPDFIVPEEYYEIVMCFLTFNTTALLGTICSNWIKWPSPKTMLIPVLLRGLFIPFFFFCNYQPTNKVRKVPVLFSNDWLYWTGSVFLGFTSGFLGTKAMMYTTRGAGSAYQSISGKFGSAALVTGIFLGVFLSILFPFLAGL